MIEASKEPLRVSDHAVLRYLERAMDLNIEVVREHILGICAGPAAFGAVRVRSEGLRFEIEKMCVVTVAPDSPSLSRTAKARAAARVREGKST